MQAVSSRATTVTARGVAGGGKDAGDGDAGGLPRAFALGATGSDVSSTLPAIFCYRTPPQDSSSVSCFYKTVFACACVTLSLSGAGGRAGVLPLYVYCLLAGICRMFTLASLPFAYLHHPCFYAAPHLSHMPAFLQAYGADSSCPPLLPAFAWAPCGGAWC